MVEVIAIGYQEKATDLPQIRDGFITFTYSYIVLTSTWALVEHSNVCNDRQSLYWHSTS